MSNLEFNCYGGSGVGLAHNMEQIGAFGPANFDEEFNNTFYVGASTISETGLSLVLLGSKLVVDRIEYIFLVKSLKEMFCL